MGKIVQYVVVTAMIVFKGFYCQKSDQDLDGFAMQPSSIPGGNIRPFPTNDGNNIPSNTSEGNIRPTRAIEGNEHNEEHRDTQRFDHHHENVVDEDVASVARIKLLTRRSSVYCQSLLRRASQMNFNKLGMIKVMIQLVCPKALWPWKPVTPRPKPPLHEIMEQFFGSKGSSTQKTCGSMSTTRWTRGAAASRLATVRVVNGRPAVKGEYKFLATVHYKTHMICAATIISHRHALTAAHCIRNLDARQLSVGAGEFDIRNFDNNKRIRVTRIIVHPKYEAGKSSNDIAILTLAKSTIGLPLADIVCLPVGRQCRHLRNRKCSIVGWGATRHVGNTWKYPRIPHHATVNTYDAARCPYRNPAPSDVTAQLCAVGTADTCLGDSGGPLVCEYGGRWIQCGITSYGPRQCNAPRSNGIYTSVISYKKWIDSVIGA